MKKFNQLLREGEWWLRSKRGRHAECRSIFVIGTGRSGTHFLTKCLISHPELNDLMHGRENPYVFNEVVDIALHNCQGGAKIEKVIDKYGYLMKVAAPQWLVDQSHPNIWLADAIARRIESAMFIGIIRDPFSVTFSTLQHAAVRKRFGKWQGNPVPSPFFGIDEDNADRYNSLSLPEQSALRWISHARRLGELKGLLGERLLIVQYEDLCLHGARVMQRIADFLGVDNGFDMPRVTTASLYKKESLSEQDVLDVRTGIENYIRRYDLEPEIRGYVQGYLDPAKGAEDAG